MPVAPGVLRAQYLAYAITVGAAVAGDPARRRHAGRGSGRDRRVVALRLDLSVNSAAVLLPHTRRRSHDYKVAGAFFAGTTSGALRSALTLWGRSGFFSYLSPAARIVALSIGAVLVWVLKQMPGALPFFLPENTRQIPSPIFGQPPARAAMKFGFELGTGVRTYVPVPAPYVLPLLLLVGWVPLGVAVSLAIGFGLGRALPLPTPLAVARSGPVGAAFLSGAAPDSAVAFLAVLIEGLYLV